MYASHFLSDGGLFSYKEYVNNTAQITDFSIWLYEKRAPGQLTFLVVSGHSVLKHYSFFETVRLVTVPIYIFHRCNYCRKIYELLNVIMKIEYKNNCSQRVGF